ncbi:Arabinose 5-phosphate isomerase KdsD [Candidatus Providencia siddallii]|uniref:Arabinose 5-phosphate isomerase n=1 Tax=Candidatus Providencia siddallii TaxID=1715285 RepID=A0A0M6W6U6_9GAMM|nr:Arabinose 5-phosphate isomerase KdsD [Candidatus Providencia siddallii]
MSILSFKDIGKEVVRIERKTINKLEECIDDNFDRACQLIFDCKGKIIIIGIGKSGHIGRKISATLTSTGTPSFFVHPVEASHGDLGIICDQDIILAISNSGETPEILNLLPFFKKNKITLICITSNPYSSIGKHADIHLCIKILQEACPFGLVPTTSTTATLIIGDALSIAVLTARRFTKSDFAIYHPGGMIGKKLLLLVRDLMNIGNDIPHIQKNASLREALIEITNKKLGMIVICDSDMNIDGIFTDGDLRRVFNTNIDLNNAKIADLMTIGGIRITQNMLAIEALKLMQTMHITSLLVTEKNKLIGVLHMNNLLQTGFL